MILIGDVRERLKELPDQSVNCCVTSPPYFGLRDYGTASWEGGDPSCDHSTARSRGDDIKTGDKQGTSAGSRPNTQRTCATCGAVRIDNQIGLEPTPQEFVDSLVAVFREVKRVLRDDGTLWVNMGDSYNGSGGNHQPHHKNETGFQGKIGAEKYKGKGRHMDADGLKPKDLVGIPWMLAFALRADGWYLRQDIIWHKPNPMPESVRDRCTKAHEYIFLLSKSPKYYFDNQAIKEPSSQIGKTKIRFGDNKYGDNDDPKYATKSGNEYTDSGFRNKRDVWSVAVKPFKDAHFATFPTTLIEPCILAGTSEHGVCDKCKSQYERIMANGEIPERKTRDKTLGVYPDRKTTTRLNSVDMAVIPKTQIGWKQTCDCELSQPVPAVVLDPFFGAGTTGLVAQRHGRKWIGCELNPTYASIAQTRIEAESNLFTSSD